MEICEFADRLLFSETLYEKLRRIERPVTDSEPGEQCRVELPARPAELRFTTSRSAPSMPHPEALRQKEKRALAHHIMANHELQAVEVMAWVLRAFPRAPREFRLGLVEIIGDEQRHTAMHVNRARALGTRFGEYPVNGYIWHKAQRFQRLLDYLAGLPLTFEARNLDHTLELAQQFEAVGDLQGASILRTIHDDEVTHVAFGLKWLESLKPAEQSTWDAYVLHLEWPLRPAKARGELVHRDARIQAGMSEEFINRIEQAPADEPRPFLDEADAQSLAPSQTLRDNH